MVSKRIVVPVMAAAAVAAVLAGVSLLGRSPGSGAAQADQPTPLPVHSSPGMPWPVTTAPMPPTCTLSDIRAAVISTSVRRTGSVIVLRLSAASRPCSLSTGAWPAVRLDLASGKTPVAKAYPYRSTLQPRPARLAGIFSRCQRSTLGLCRGYV